MSTFHKPKVFRSLVGCCICKAKSSSSRFTDSSKYEDQFQSCFKLAEARVGEICNACVLLVKRWKKLPKNTKRNWAHVVDARAGPGTKSFVKQKKKDETPEEFEKIRRKHVYHKKPRLDDDEIAPQSTMSVTSNSVDIGGGSKAAKRLNENLLSEFFDISYWKPEAGYCGTVYRGLLGEVMLDLRTPAHRQKDLQPDQEQEDLQPLEQQHLQPLTVESLIESELKKLSENKNNNNIITTDVVGKDSFEEVDSEILSMKRSSPEQDEGFCDKSSTVTGPSSPDSYNLQLEDE